eukprot:11226870-Lingulodinium_polyedra.AAC.1
MPVNGANDSSNSAKGRQGERAACCSHAMVVEQVRASRDHALEAKAAWAAGLQTSSDWPTCQEHG